MYPEISFLNKVKGKINIWELFIFSLLLFKIILFFRLECKKEIYFNSCVE